MKHVITLLVSLACMAMAKAQFFDGPGIDCDPDDLPDDFWVPGYYDADGDGYGVEPLKCFVPIPYNPPYASRSGDCNDSDPKIYPRFFYVDADGDGHGNGSLDRVSICQRYSTPPPGYASKGGDCDDSNSKINIDRTWYQDADGDTFGDPEITYFGCVPQGLTNPVANGSDYDDSNTIITNGPPRTFYYDGDGDMYGVDSNTEYRSYPSSSAYVPQGGDCDDNDVNINPNTIWYIDADGDGVGVTGPYDKIQCTQPPDEGNGTYVLNLSNRCTTVHGSQAQNDCIGEREPMAVEDSDKNYLWSVGYDSSGKIKQNSITYYDELGKALQSQSLDPHTGQLWATQTLYDSEGRPALSSFGAPIEINGIFEYKPNFIAKPDGSPYTKDDFESDEERPSEVGKQSATVGWYYSGNNDREPYQDVTDYPFLRTIYSTLQPNTPLKTIGGNKINGLWPQAYSFSMKASEELSQTPAFGNSVYNTIKTLKTVTRDVHGVENVVFADSDGLVLATARSGGPLSRSMSISIGEQGYTDIHVPEGNTMGFTVETQGNSVTVYDLITETTVTPSKSLPNGFYRVAVDDTENYTAGSVTVTYQENYYDYALNEYDPAGRLVASYQPLGKSLQQKPKTTYTYNALGQLIYSNSPDEGQAWFKYRKDGQIRYSQNSEQKSRNAFSYTNYDNLGRPAESGIVENAAFNTIDPNDTTEGTPAGLKKEQVYTHYDEPLKTSNCTDPICITVAQRGGQKYVRSNVSSTQNSQSTTYYSYDIYGRVEWIVQDLLGVGIKTIDYTYHPISGLVTQVTYQKEATDQFIHRYTYNILDQLTQVETSTKGTTYQTQAEYTYYESGELKRAQLADGSQGLDYVYNLNGQLKSINHPSLLSTDDPGGDGNDLFGIQLDYHHADYQRAVANIQSATYGTDRWDGNLKGIRWNNGTPSAAPQGYAFQYNRNNWLTSADYDPLSRNGIISMNLPIYTTYIDDDGNIVCGTPFQTTPSGNNSHGDYDVSEIVYDANGNIQHLVRRKNTRNGSNAMDDLTYSYDPDKPNQLLQVADAAGDAAHADDIGHQSDPKNYVYNTLGQLVTNKAEGISYIYNASGLVTEVQKNSQPVVKFFYNDRNHRVKKESYANGNLVSTTYYVRDLAGQVMAIYNKRGSAVALAEQPIYGLNRIGVAYNGNRNTKRYVYELTDHLGNVRATFTKNNNQEAQREGYTDYYPFGMPMPGRNLVGDYRYAFQGQEKDPETGKEAFELRLWDSRIGRWLSPDPYGQYSSPYLGMGNNPINGIDPDGGCFTTDANGNTIPCLDTDVGTTMVGNAGYEWTMGSDGWARSDGYEVLVTALRPTYENYKTIPGISVIPQTIIDNAFSQLGSSQGEQLRSLGDFSVANSGLTYGQIINQRNDRSKTFLGSQPGGPNIRYIQDPLNRDAVIDLRHMLYIGSKGPYVGNSVELLQALGGQKSAGDFQDAYSNFLGYQFHHAYKSKLGSNPTKFADYLTEFLISSEHGRLHPNMGIQFFRRVN